MTRSAAIVSFDDAKRSGRTLRFRSSGENTSTATSGRPLVYFDPGQDVRFTAPSRRTSRRTAASHAPSTSASRNVVSRGTMSRFEAPRSAAPRKTPSWYAGADERALRDEAARRAQVRQEASGIEADEQTAEKPSLGARLRRLKAKRKADKMFDFSGGTASTGEGGPRAALYKGEMGSSQRRASRMQNTAAESSPSSTPSVKRRAASHPRLAIVLASVACLTLVCVFLYQPAQQYYQAMREHEALAAEYAALQERGNALQSDVDALSSDAGMEEIAHEQYGLVKQGETSVSVSGLNESSKNSSLSIPPNVAAGSFDPPDTWYSVILDPLFGVN